METTWHSMSSLFDQLGLASSDDAIDEFVARNRPLASNIELHCADFWSTAQSSLLKEAKDQDADWAEIIDQLDALLR